MSLRRAGSMASYSGPDHLAALAPGTKITASYETSGERLGHGFFGVVYPATHVSDQQQVALKILYPGSHDDRGNEWQEEIDNLSKAGRLPTSVNVIRLVEAFVWEREGQKHFCLATAPICEGGDLMTLLTDRSDSYRLASALRWSLQVIAHANMAVETGQPQYDNGPLFACLCVSLQVAEALHALHTTLGVELYHGDVAPRNILLRRVRAASACRPFCHDPRSTDCTKWNFDCPVGCAYAEASSLDAYVGDLGVAIHNHQFGIDKDQLLKYFSVSIAPEQVGGGAGTQIQIVVLL